MSTQRHLLNQFLDSERRYTFSDYFELTLAARDIVRGFGGTLEQRELKILRYPIPDLSFLRRSLEVNQRRNRLENEIVRRSAIVAPILTEVCEIADLQLDTEYSISVSSHLTGIVDYQIDADAVLLIAEAKQSDLVRGFKQLVAELIALHYWTPRNAAQLFGCVTDGERWQFSYLERSNLLIAQDTTTYFLNDLDELTEVLTAIVSSSR